MVVIVVVTTIYLIYSGYSYYNTAFEERFYHPHHDWFKPSGAFGHGLGIVGTLMMLVGVGIYIARKRYNFLSKYIKRLKYLLEFHIFLCTLGPILILFHTAFKFGGIVSVAFWSMVAVVLSGVLGRFIYLQIPRSIEGRELTLNELQDMKTDLSLALNERFNVNDRLVQNIVDFTQVRKDGSNVSLRKLINLLKKGGVPKAERKAIVKMVRNEVSLSRKIASLQTMQKLFRYWHVAHLPFALVMLIIVVLHVGVTLAFGYKWIF